MSRAAGTTGSYGWDSLGTATDQVEVAWREALAVIGKAHKHALAGKRRPHHLALHTVIKPCRLTRRNEVDVLTHLVAARQRWRRVAAHLRKQPTSRKGQGGGQWGRRGGGGPR